MIWFLLLLWPLIYLAHAVITLILFLAIMRLQEMRDKNLISKPLYPFAMFFLWVGFFVDFTFNLHSTITFLELPKEWLFSSRVSRLIKTTGWRSTLSKFVCKNFLDPVDPSGCHCK